MGVSIDDNLTFDKFLREKYGKVHSLVYQPGKMRKYIESITSCLIYKQMILPLSDYADIMVKSGPSRDMTRLENLPEMSLKIIDNNWYHRALVVDLMRIYKISPISQRQDEH